MRSRYVKKADAFVLSGVAFLLIGAVAAVIFAPFGIFILIVGTIEIAYGLSKRSEANEEYPVEVLEREEEARAIEPEPEESDAELLYDQLLTKFIDKWGVQTGMQLLESEIRAYTWHGDTFAEAVRKVSRRQQKKTS